MAAFTALAIASLVSAGVSAWNQHEAGQNAEKAGAAAQSASNSEADLSDWNAKVADLQAKDAVDRGAEQEARFRTQVRGMIGGQRTGFAAGNIDVGYGSAVDVQSDAAYLGELDALTIRTNAAREAWGYTVNAADLRARATIQRKEGVAQAAAGSEAATSANWAAVGSLAGTGTSLLQARYGMGTR